MNFNINLEDMKTSNENPISITLDSVKSIKEDRIKLTAPLFCKTTPSLTGFKTLNSTLLTGPIASHPERDKKSNFVFLDGLLIYLTPNSPKLQLLHIHPNQTNTSAFSLSPIKTYTLSGLYHLSETAPFTSLQALSS